MATPALSFWRWFFGRRGSRPGLLRLLDPWLCLHVLIGVVLTMTVKASMQLAANTVLLPLAGIFIGLAFAWAGNAQAMLQSAEIEEIALYHEGGFVEYAFAFQTAILTILITLVLWGLAGLGIFDEYLPAAKYPLPYASLKAILFAASSASLRECWHVVLGAQWMLLSQHQLKRARSSKEIAKKELSKTRGDKS